MVRLRVAPGVAVLLMFVVALAGCVQQEDAPVNDAPFGGDPHAGHAELTAWSREFTDCHEAGSVAAYNRDGIGVGGSHVPAPWVLADMRDELGDPHTSSLGEPMLGPVTGHWHMAIVCSELRFGYVGVAVEAPPFDWGGAERHILFSGLSVDDDGVRDAIAAVTGFTPTRTLRAEVQSLAPDVLYAALDDETKGVYEGWGPVFEIQAKEPHTVRWWTTVTDGDNEAPVALDVIYTAPTRHATTGESIGVGCHTGTPMHGPQGGICQTAIIASYQSAAVTLAFGGSPNATVAHAWHH